MRKFRQRVVPLHVLSKHVWQEPGCAEMGCSPRDADGVPVLPKPVSSQGKQKPK